LRTWIALVLAAVMTCSCACGLEISAQAAVLYDPLSGKALYQKAENERLGMASTTKIMTALVALELYPPDQSVEIKREWCGVEGSTMYLKAGEHLAVIDLLYGLMLMSGNDAATALAGLCPGGQPEFVRRMNEKAKDLGMADTSFENPSGLDGEAHYSTAHDMALLAAEALKNDALSRIMGSKWASQASRYMRNHNKLLGTISGALGLKTGYTKKSGRCLVSAVNQKGRTLIAVTLNAPDDWRDHQNLYAEAFGQMSERRLVAAGEAGRIPLIWSERPECAVVVRENFSFFLSDEEMSRLRVVLEGPRFCYGRVEEGARYGALSVYLDKAKLFSTPAYFSETVEERPLPKSGFALFWERLFGD